MSDQSIREILAGNFMFRELSSDELTELTEQVWVEKHPAGEVIEREGEPADALFLLVSGGVDVIKKSGQFLAYLGPSGFFGEMALFSDEGVRSATVDAAEAPRCVVLSKDFVHRFCEEPPDTGIKIYRAIIESLSQRLQATSADLAMLMQSEVKSQGEVANIVERAKAKAQSREEPSDARSSEQDPS